MQKKYRYTFFDNLSFYFSYLFYKCILPLEVKKPRWKLWWYEWLYSLAKVSDYTRNIPWRYSIDRITTRFGTFKIRINTSDAANVSPAFERRDQNYLLAVINKLCKQNKKVLFLDIGGDLGSYSVLVGNRFKNESVQIKCFEPVKESCDLIKENAALNGIEDAIEIFQVALLNEDNPEARITLDVGTPGSSTMKNSSSENIKEIVIRTNKLDTLLADTIAGYDVIVCKIDVEGVEREVLLGAENVINSGKEVYVMLEDFINPDIITFMEQNGWSFLAKTTSYNSWWYFCKR